jgi:hypothetical protein
MCSGITVCEIETIDLKILAVTAILDESLLVSL